MLLPSSPLRARVHHLYYGTTADARRFRYAVLAFDMATIVFVIGTSFIPRSATIGLIDVAIGIVLALEFVTRLAGSRRPWREALRIASLADLLAIASFLAPVTGEAAGFLRIMRTLRLIHYPTWKSDPSPLVDEARRVFDGDVRLAEDWDEVEL